MMRWLLLLPPLLLPADAGDTISAAIATSDGTTAFLCAQTQLKHPDMLYRLDIDAEGSMAVATALELPDDPTGGTGGSAGWKQINCGSRLALDSAGNVYVPMTQYASPGGEPALLRVDASFTNTTVVKRVNLDSSPFTPTLRPPNQWPCGNPTDLVVVPGIQFDGWPEMAIVALQNGTLLQIPTEADALAITGATAFTEGALGCGSGELRAQEQPHGALDSIDSLSIPLPARSTTPITSTPAVVACIRMFLNEVQFHK